MAPITSPSIKNMITLNIALYSSLYGSSTITFKEDTLAYNTIDIIQS